MHIHPDVRAWARRHHGLVTRSAWLDTGHSRRSFDRAIAAGVLVRVERNVAALAGAPATPVQRIAAGVLSIEREVRASHRSAAFLWGADVAGTDPVDVLVVDRAVATRRPGLCLHRPRDLRQVHAVQRLGIPTTTPLRTLVDLGAVAAEAVPGTLERFLIDGIVSVRMVEEALARHRGPGRRGVSALEAALAGLPLGRKAPDSVLEAAMARLFARHGIDGWTFHARALRYELDFGFLAERVDVEVDGFRFHREGFEADRERDAELTAAGWVVLRFTWRQVKRRPDVVASTVLATLALRRSGMFPGHR